MDTNIRTLLTAAQKLGVDKGGASLNEAFSFMKNVAETRPSIDSPDSFGQDLYVICAEVAFQHGKNTMAKECLEMYFMKTPPTNQFLCRAYLCQAQLLAPSSAENQEQLEKAVVYLVKAINLAKENTRYHFLVYNASVIYWRFSRPFLKPKYRQYLAHSLHQVVKALDDIEDKDYEWRAQLMIALIECHMDAGRKSDASHIASAAVAFIKSNVPSLYKSVFGLMVRHQLIEISKFQKDLKLNPELNVYYRICRLKLAIEQRDTDRDVEEEMYKILSAVSNQELKPEKKEKEDKGTRGGRSSASGEERLKSPSRPTRSSNRTPTPTMGKKMVDDSPEKPYLLLEVGRLALEQRYPTVGELCVSLIKDSAHLISDPGFFLEVEFLQSELLVRSLGDKQESYQKAYIDIRQQAIKRCDEAILNAVRLANPKVIQAGCVTQWNLCLPLIQNNLRQHVRRPLITIANALEDIQSLLRELRCQVHMELSKCEEDIEQIEVAMEHIKKALELDDAKQYQERLKVMLRRLELRGELYKQPESSEDQAAQIIEQLNAFFKAGSSGSGSIRMKRSLLVRAGLALAPDAFFLVLESENFDREVAGGKGPLTVIRKLAGKAQNFNKNVKKAEGHLRRLGNERDRERARLWGDLARAARKHEVWDVCRVAARFCLLYDDGRWKVEPPVRERNNEGLDKRVAKKRKKQKRNDEIVDSVGDVTVSDAASREKTQTGGWKKESSEATSLALVDPSTAVYDRDLVRLMAEVNFINGEALIHLLRSEGVQLGNKPIPPVDKSKHPKGYVPKKPEEDPDWIEYVEWITALSESAVGCFLRSVTLGQDLYESWIVCSAAAYLWNYYNHVLQDKRNKEITDSFQALVDGFKKVGHSGETVLLVNVCNALAEGLIQPSLPKPPDVGTKYPSPPPEKDVNTTSPTELNKKAPSPTKEKEKKPKNNKKGEKEKEKKEKGKKGRTLSPDSKKKGGNKAVVAVSSKKSLPTFTVDPENIPDIKRAVEICEYAMKITNGDREWDVVPLAVRHPLLQTWIQAKQLLQASVPKGFGTDDENDFEGQKPMTRAMVATEMAWVSNNGIFEFKETPQLSKIVDMVEMCGWPDRLLELQLWTRLAYIGLETKDHNIVVKCANKALYFKKDGTQPKGKKHDSHKYMVEQEMLSFAASIYGQSLVLNAQGKNAVRRQAMEQFLQSARFGKNARNYDMVLTAARHYWNAALPLINQPIERELLSSPISMMLDYITEVTDKDRYRKKEKSTDCDSA